MSIEIAVCNNKNAPGRVSFRAPVDDDLSFVTSLIITRVTDESNGLVDWVTDATQL